MFVVKKKIHGQEYYYLRKSERIDGKVKAVSVAYLGKNRKEADKKARVIIDDLDVKKEKNLSMQKREDKSMDERNVDECRKKNGNIKNEKEEKEFLSFIQEAGLVWGPSPEIYGGLAGFYVYGPLGKLLKNKVENSVREIFNSNGFREIETPTIFPDKVWEASGHLGNFADRTVTCLKCGAVFRADKLIEEKFDVAADGFGDDKLLSFIEDKGVKCPSCKGSFEKKINRESLMMKTKVAGKDASLRPETATGTYLPFLRMQNYFRKKLPFAVYQIGKAYRNEISPRQHVLRGREFTQAEGQIFVDPEKKNNWEKYEQIKNVRLPFWNYKNQEGGGHWDAISIEDALKKGFIQSEAYAWCIWLAYSQFEGFGIPKERIRLRQHGPDEKAFYAVDAWDVEVKMNNYGWVEVCGVHDRTDYDLKQHAETSGVKLEAVRENGEKYIPHVLEIAFGTDRPTYALIDIFYDKKEIAQGKTTFKIPYHMAPIDVSVFPLMKKPELKKIAEDVKRKLSRDFIVDYDVSGSIGKRYLRSSNAGTPFAITVDYDSLEKEDVTVRDRDSEKQVRVKIDELSMILRRLSNGELKFEDL